MTTPETYIGLITLSAARALPLAQRIAAALIGHDGVDVIGVVDRPGWHGGGADIAFTIAPDPKRCTP